VASAPAGSIASAGDLVAASLDWCDASVPCTAASALRTAGRWTLDDQVDFDADDWWWRSTFRVEPRAPNVLRVLRFEGLATLADVWLNGRSILESNEMFAEHEVAAAPWIVEGDNELVVRCRSLGAALKARRPRPRWRTRVVEAQQLRWFRTSMYGRIPAWAPAVAPVGPWRPIVIEERSHLTVVTADVRPRVQADDGVIEVRLELDVVGVVHSGWVLCGGERAGDLSVSRVGEHRFVVEGTVRVSSVARWWPHTHGAPVRRPLEIIVGVGSDEVPIAFAPVSFRTLEIDRAAEGFALRVNDVEVFCRGACWTPVDAAALVGSEAEYRKTLTVARDGGMNMVRVGGPFFYETDAFYDVCDELGLLVWQDFAFANMDYPGDDAAFVDTVDREARGFLDRTQLAACIGVLCGNGEVEQQAAMAGAARELWRSPLFSSTLPAACAALRPDVPYWPSTPSGGALPFMNDTGTAHYFGVGAYLRPLEDSRRAQVRFATECLAFANVPEPRVCDELMKGGGVPPQDPRWKRRTPRDGSAGWDFDDVRDHYLRALFGVDPLAVRYADPARYLALSRVVTGEVMAATFAEWRRLGSTCAGALVWFLRDLWDGAGWGVLDANAEPKAAYYSLKRVLQPIAVLLADEGLNGIDVHLANDGPNPVDGDLDVLLLRRGETPVANPKRPVRLEPRTTIRVRTAALLEHFLDTSYAYRFGPPSHDVIVATFTERSSGLIRGRAFHFPQGLALSEQAEVGLEAVAAPLSEGRYRLVVRARRLARSVALDVPGFRADDNYFHVAPGAPHVVLLSPLKAATAPRGTAQCLNAVASAKITLANEGPSPQRHPEADSSG
jgi:beta-mannosidase